MTIELPPMGALVTPKSHTAPVCREPNRERPPRLSQQMSKDDPPAIVVDHIVGRYPMIKLLACIDGKQVFGYALANDFRQVDTPT